MITFIKLGGSLITDKRQENTYRPEAAAAVASALAAALAERPDLRILLGHGSGSFGHMAAKRYGTMAGVRTPEQWRGYAAVGTVAAELNYLLARTLTAAGLPVLRLQPSASARARDGVLVELATEPVQAALDHGLLALVHGDVALDEMRGGTIVSTETVFFYLARRLPVTRIFLLGEVDGVYGLDGAVIPLITPATLPAVEQALGGSSGTDVTGGMETKVRDMVALTQQVAGLAIRIFSGRDPDLLTAALTDRAQPGTLIRAD